MNELSVSLQDHLALSAALHSRLCPRQVLGVRMARLACALLDVDPALNRKSIYVFMEIGRCAADAVMVVTGASPTNELMRLIKYGKVAATFVNTNNGDAIRVSERQDCREIAVGLLPELPTWEAQRDAYQFMRDDELFDWQRVYLNQPLPIIPDKHAVTCEQCGERINEHREVVVDGETLCKPCAFGAYFIPINIPLDVLTLPV